MALSTVLVVPLPVLGGAGEGRQGGGSRIKDRTHARFKMARVIVSTHVECDFLGSAHLCLAAPRFDLPVDDIRAWNTFRTQTDVGWAEQLMYCILA